MKSLTFSFRLLICPSAKSEEMLLYDFNSRGLMSGWNIMSLLSFYENYTDYLFTLMTRIICLGLNLTCSEKL